MYNILFFILKKDINNLIQDRLQKFIKIKYLNLTEVYLLFYIYI